MQKIKIKIVLLFSILVFSTVIIAARAQASAHGSATVWWVAPTTNEDGSTPIDLLGYRIFYSSTIDFSTAGYCPDVNAAADQTTRTGTLLFTNATDVFHVDVTDVNALRDAGDATKRGYTFNTGMLLAPGATYNFAVVAYDANGNYSKCAQTSGGATNAQKATVSYAADANTTGLSFHKVDLNDYNVLFSNFGNSTCGNAADFTGPNSSGVCAVNIFDYSIMFDDFGKSF